MEVQISTDTTAYHYLFLKAVEGPNLADVIATIRDSAIIQPSTPVRNSLSSTHYSQHLSPY